MHAHATERALHTPLMMNSHVCSLASGRMPYFCCNPLRTVNLLHQKKKKQHEMTVTIEGMVLCVCPPFPKCSCQGIVSKRFLHTTSPHGEIQSQRQLGEFERHCVGTTSTRRKSQTKRTEHLVVVIIIIIIIIGATTDMQAVDGATVLKSKIKIFWPVCRYVLYRLMLRTFSLRL